MKILVTGSAGHLGEALMRSLPAAGHEVSGLDIKPSDFTDHVCSITDAGAVSDAMQGIDTVLHTATLHKPHVATHTVQDFIDINITGTSNLLNAARATGVSRFVYTSTTSAFGDAMKHASGAPAVWVDESLPSNHKNIYGLTKTSAEGLCQLASRNHGLPTVILRTSRFFPEEDDDATRRAAFDDLNLKVNELLYRRVDIEDLVPAHLLAAECAESLGHASFVISAPAGLTRDDATTLGQDAASVIHKHYPNCAEEYRKRGWRLPPIIDRVYDSSHAVQTLGWSPRYTFSHALECFKAGKSPFSALAATIGKKGYHDEVFADGPYPVLPIS